MLRTFLIQLKNRNKLAFIFHVSVQILLKFSEFHDRIYVRIIESLTLKRKKLSERPVPRLSLFWLWYFRWLEKIKVEYCYLSKITFTFAVSFHWNVSVQFALMKNSGTACWQRLTVAAKNMPQFSWRDVSLAFPIESFESFHEISVRAGVFVVDEFFVDWEKFLKLVLLLPCKFRKGVLKLWFLSACLFLDFDQNSSSNS